MDRLNPNDNHVDVCLLRQMLYDYFFKFFLEIILGHYSEQKSFT